MPIFTDQRYDAAGAWISGKINEGYSWDDVKRLCVSAAEFQDAFDELQNGEMIIPPDMTADQWQEFVDVHHRRFSFVEIPVGFSASRSINAIAAPLGFSSAWVKYRNYLAGAETGKRKVSDEGIENITAHSLFVVNQLKKDTRDSLPVKGLVMGSVQSGKTANMGGLLSMAADYDWNFFIVLSGTIDNLRKQTRDRFRKDLRNTGSVSWRFLDYVGCRDGTLRDIDDESKTPLKVDDLKLNGLMCGSIKHPDRYVITCLKQASRLRYLLDWLYDSSQGRSSRLRIVIIDDEADQASVNTSRMDNAQSEEEVNRTRVNRLICNMANGLTADGEKPRVGCNAVNYVSYTATPYANVLNEAWKGSLYPSDFIYALSEPREYFGGRVIFGSQLNAEDYPGLEGIVHSISTEEVAALSNLQGLAAEGTYIPTELQNSLLWFLCSAAVLRTKRWRKPISMLIHTTAQTDPHFDIYEAVRCWLMRTETETLVGRACEIYTNESGRFLKSDLMTGFSSYACMNTVMDALPTFEEIVDEIRAILTAVNPIMMDSDRELHYLDDAIHLCVDNCKANHYSDDDSYLRIVYPTDDQLENDLTKAPVFIVIGGNTLSRGLTIEGLVCTYFTRGSNQADSLMQMGRWFGYRQGYELLQRIWMTDAVRDRFELLAEINEKLLEEVRRFAEDPALTPSMFGPKVLNTSQISRFRITSRNKMQNAEDVDFDFTGDSFETTKFDDDDEALRSNIDTVNCLVEWLGVPVASESSDHSFVWRGISFSELKYRLFDRFKMASAANQYRDFQMMIKWLGENVSRGVFVNWNVSVAGNADAVHAWIVNGKNPGMIERTRMRGKAYIDIRSLRSGVDALSDVSVSSLSEEQKLIYRSVRRSRRGINAARSALGLSDTPLLLLYCIDKDGGVEKQTRTKLGVNYDVMGISIIIPGEMSGNSRSLYLQVRMPL